MAAIAASVIVLMPGAGTAQTTTTQSEQQPNFIILLVDDLGYNDVGCYGSSLIKTPRIDQMASEGARYMDFYTAPSCTPTRAALMTGSHAPRVGFGDNLQNVHGKFSPSQVVHPDSPYGLNPDEITLPEILKTAGYSTGMVGKWHLGDAEKFNPVHHGFDYFFGVPYSNDMKPFYYLQGTGRLEESPDNDLLTRRFTEEAVNYIRQNKGKPFFLYLAHAMPHTPLGASPDFKGKSERGAYGDAVEELDWSVGQVLDTVKEAGIDEKTLVVFLSDNGPWYNRGENGGSATPLRGAKGSTYEGGVRVPCVVRWPGTMPPGGEVKEIATVMDILPTFAAIAGNEAPRDRVIDGKDITALLTGGPDTESPHEKIFYYFGEQLHAVRSGPWKLRLENYLQNENVYERAWRDLETTVPIPAALYNLDQDPGEQKNVLKNHPKIEARLRGYIEEARKDSGDSLFGAKGANMRPVGRR